mmetsp:Transcript_321/g.1079  ORF Transcript_321/g.1079 Transcript_321/m.1079 type:complete len:101 (+) Transcript_321:123-425(+)
MDGEEDGETDANIKLLEALMLYSPRKLVGVHKHFCLLGICEHLERSTGTKVRPEQVLELVEKYYDLSQLEVEEEDAELESVEQDFELPANFSAPNPNNGS